MVPGLEIRHNGPKQGESWYISVETPLGCEPHLANIKDTTHTSQIRCTYLVVSSDGPSFSEHVEFPCCDENPGTFACLLLDSSFGSSVSPRITDSSFISVA